MRRRTHKGWDYFGRSDPYYAVLTEQHYHRTNLNEEARSRFFETGQLHMNEALDTIKSQLNGSFRPNRGLDFGCGVGRLAIPMAAICNSVVAADVSQFMLKEAEENCKRIGITNVEFVRSDDELHGISGPFDLINSHLVFQHIPRKQGMKMFRRLLEMLNDGGVGVFHFTYFRRSSIIIRFVYWIRKSSRFMNGLANLILKRPLGYPMMEMNEYQLNEVFRALQENSCKPSQVTFSSDATSYEVAHGVVIFCQKSQVDESLFTRR